MESFFWSYILQNPTQLLTWFVYGVGILLSILYQKENRKRSTLTLIAFAIFLLDSVLNTVLFAWTLNFDSMVKRGQYYQAYSCISTPLWLAAWILLLIALFPQISGAHKTTSIDA